MSIASSRLALIFRWEFVFGVAPQWSFRRTRAFRFALAFRHIRRTQITKRKSRKQKKKKITRNERQVVRRLRRSNLHQEQQEQQEQRATKSRDDETF